MNRLLRRCCACVVAGALVLSTMVAATNRYLDVPDNHWAVEEIYQATELGLFNGTSAVTFGLGQSLTRGAFAVVLCRMMDWDTSTVPEPSFTDCAPRDWYYAAVETALSHDVFTAQYDEFRPKDPITREEMAVAMVRALGYTTLAGTTTGKLPFQDVSTNPGYIAIANSLGLMHGTSVTSFAPEGVATREQTAVILVRLHEKRTAPTNVMGIVRDLEDMVALTVADTVALAGTSLSRYSLRLDAKWNPEAQRLAVDTVHQNGGTALLHIAANADSLKHAAMDQAALIVTQVEALGYDGVYLDMDGVTQGQRGNFTQLVQALDTALGQRALHVTAQATGDNLSALTQLCDNVVVEIAPYAQTTGGFLIAPMEPMEEVYRSLSTLPAGTDLSKITLQFTTTATVRTGSSGSETSSASAITAYLADGNVRQNQSLRYGCSYLTSAQSDVFSAWYLSGENVAQHQQLAALLGITSFCASDLSSLLPDVEAQLFGE